MCERVYLWEENGGRRRFYQPQKRISKEQGPQNIFLIRSQVTYYSYTSAYYTYIK